MGYHYVVVAHTIRGSYFVSEDITDLGYLQDVRDRFQAMVDYFGGGTVLVYREAFCSEYE